MILVKHPNSVAHLWILLLTLWSFQSSNRLKVGYLWAVSMEWWLCPVQWWPQVCLSRWSLHLNSPFHFEQKNHSSSFFFADVSLWYSLQFISRSFTVWGGLEEAELVSSTWSISSLLFAACLGSCLGFQSWDEHSWWTSYLKHSNSICFNYSGLFYLSFSWFMVISFASPWLIVWLEISRAPFWNWIKQQRSHPQQSFHLHCSPHLLHLL